MGDDRLDVQLEGSSLPLGSWSSIPLGDEPVTKHVQVSTAGVSLSFQLTFRRGGRALTQPVYAKSGFPGEFARFGSLVAVSRDTLVATTAVFNTESATVFRRTGAVWAREQLLPQPDVEDDDFGASVAVSGDTIVVGAPFNDRVVSASGTVFVYRRGWAGWVLGLSRLIFKFRGGTVNAPLQFRFNRWLLIDGFADDVQDAA